MKVMLINPPQKRYKYSLDFNAYIPIGLLSVASLIKEICEVKILDCTVVDFEIKKDKNYILYGTPFKKIEAEIKKFKPNIVGVSCPFSTQMSSALEICRISKKVDSGIIVVCGGADASVRYKSYLEHSVCDFCIVGEGEYAFKQFIQHLTYGLPVEEIKGLVYKKKGKLYFNLPQLIENLDHLPFPSYELINFNDYFRNSYLYKYRSFINENSLLIITSRGCPYDCVFCSIHSHMGKRYRAHSPEYVFKHLKYCVEELGITNFHFEDDNLTLDKKRFDNILDKIIQNKLKINWDTPNGTHAMHLDFNLLKKIKKSGCKRLTISIESGNQRVLSEIVKKDLDIKYAIQVAKWCKQLGLRLTAFYLIGFPGETVHTMRDTINLALKLYDLYDVQPWLQIVTPFYGTQFYNICVRKGLIDQELSEEELANMCQLHGIHLIETDDFDSGDIDELVEEFERKKKRISLKYYLKRPFFTLTRIIKKPEYKHKSIKEVFLTLYDNL